MKMSTLEDLFIEELKDLYDGEKQITRALPKMEKAASSTQLTEAFHRHLQQTQEHLMRLERVFSDLGKAPGHKTCEGIAGIVAEGSAFIENDADPAVKDAALIAAAQRMEHYEMAGYGCVRAWAELLGHNRAAMVLQQTLDDEKAGDKKLTEIARNVNMEAGAGPH